MARATRTKESRPAPYGSAADLPSYKEMFEQIQAGKMLTRLIGRKHRGEFLELERNLDHLTAVVDGFYDRLGSRNWVFHDSLNLTEIQAVLDGTHTPDQTEERLIEIYRDQSNLARWTMRLQWHVALRARSNQIQRALEHYQAKQFDSCVLHLIAVMDGFVNDFQPAVRHGLASRDPDDMVAWDSVVGHHLGLTHAMKTFRKTVKKRIDHEVFDVLRNGIVHGMVVNFDNVVVATKAWNMLFAVVDWARATDKAAMPKEPDPSWNEISARLRRNAAHKTYAQKFEPSTIRQGHPGFDDDEIVERVNDFLEAWEHGRWALVARFQPPLLLGSFSTPGEVASFAKEVFGQFEVSSWNIEEVVRYTPGGADVFVRATVNGDEDRLKLRMVLWAEDGTVAVPGELGATWYVGVWAPRTYSVNSA